MKNIEGKRLLVQAIGRLDEGIGDFEKMAVFMLETLMPSRTLKPSRDGFNV